MDLSLDMTLRLLLALAIGSAIGVERTLHGRPAGFRTHALVCVSTALLMFLTAYQGQWMEAFGEDFAGQLVLDPTRMAQGIMTGIGFLGAGAIIKEGFSVRGLTTAASLWMTASIGILVGMGMSGPALLAAVITLGVLYAFGRLENLLPARLHVDCTLRFAAQRVLEEPALRELFARHGFKVHALGYSRIAADRAFQYLLVVSTPRPVHVSELAATLRAREDLIAFDVLPRST